MKKIFLPAVLVSALTLLLLSVGAFRSSQWKIADSFYVGTGEVEDIVIVAIDNQSIQAIGRWPWARSVHADLIGRLSAAAPRAIGYDVNFPESSNEADDAALERAIARAGIVVLPFEGRVRLERTPPVAEDLLLPLQRFSKNASLGISNAPPDSDGVLRRIPSAVVTVEGEMRPSFFRAVRQTAGEETSALPDVLVVNFAGPAGAIPHVSAFDVLSGKIPEDFFRGKIVLVGATAPDLHDVLLTPTAKTVPMSGVEIHANAIASSRTGGLREEALPFVALTVILFAFIAAFAAERLRRILHGILLIGGMLVGYLVLAFVLFESGIILNVFYPTVSLLLAAAAATLLRLSREKREKGQLRATLGRYLSPQVVDYVLEHPERLALGGEKREMTVLFSDLRGFTSISERLKPEQLVSVLNIYLTAMTEIVFANGGVLDKYIGDAVMAFWNAPLDRPDHAEAAVRTAIAMRDRLKEMNASGAFPDGIMLHLGIGVNTGPMVVGNMGGRERFDYTVLGDAVNLASRIEGLNKEYGTEILISEATVAKLSPSFRLRSLESVTVKGKSVSVEIFEVLGLATELASSAKET